MAALVFGEHLRRAGLDDHVTVSSVGVGEWHVGEGADPRTVKVLAANGYPTDHIAAVLSEESLGADLLLAMDTGHLTAVRAEVDDPDRVVLLRSFDPDSPDGAEVPDPYFGGPRGFDDVLEMIEAAMPGLVEWVRTETTHSD